MSDCLSQITVSTEGVCATGVIALHETEHLNSRKLMVQTLNSFMEIDPTWIVGKGDC